MTDQGTFKTTSNLLVWPLGFDVAMSAPGTDQAAGTYVIVARPDGDFPAPSAAWERAAELNAPGLMLVFKDEAAVDRMIADLQQVRQIIADNPDRPFASLSAPEAPKP